MNKNRGNYIGWATYGSKGDVTTMSLCDSNAPKAFRIYHQRTVDQLQAKIDVLEALPKLSDREWEIVCLALQDRILESRRFVRNEQDEGAKKALVEKQTKAVELCNKIAVAAELNEVFKWEV